MKRRLESIDLLRGLVIALMALDHVRDYFFAGQGHDPLDLATTTPALFFTRWVTHYCAPTFVFLAGVSAWLQVERGKSPWFLFQRGLWLVALELTVIGFGWQFWRPGAVVLQVMWAIGTSMMVLSLLARLPPNVVLGVGVAIVCLHNATDAVTGGTLWKALHTGGKVDAWPLPFYFAYPILPWVGIMAFGYGVGRVFGFDQQRRRRTLALLGAALTAGFFVVRGLDRYGDPGHWFAHAAAWQTAGDFVDVKKYPPSLQYALMTLGPSISLLAWLDSAPAIVSRVLLPFGRAPLFFYVAHIYLVHTLSILLGAVTGYPLRGLVNPLFAPPEELAGWGLSLAGTYAVWLLVLALLWPPARWFSDLKARRRDWWLSYL